jgi:serine/threonine protein kinase
LEDFVLEKVLKNDDRQKIEVIYNPKTNQRFIKRSVNDDIRYIYKMLQKINNNHIPKIYDVELTDKTVVIEEFVQGITLNEFMENHFEFAKGQINSIAKQLVSAMEALHKCSIIHRDIKPDNIIMNSEGHIWLIDYDIARIVNNEVRKDTTVLGTVGYAPVEQFGMMPTDYKTDIYAFGATIEQLMKYSGAKGRLLGIAQKCKRLDPMQRYQSIKQLKRAMSMQFINGVTIGLTVLILCIAIVCCMFVMNLKTHIENRYDDYIGTWHNDSNVSLEVLSVDNNIMTFNLKQQQGSGGIYSINNVTAEINNNTVDFHTDNTDGTLKLNGNEITVKTTSDTKSSSSINADEILEKDIQMNVNGNRVILENNPVLMIDDEIYVPYDTFPREIKLDAYYDSGTWAGDSEKRITIMNDKTIIFFSSFDGMDWNLYVTHDENIKTSYPYEYEQITISSCQPAEINDTIYIPLKIFAEQFGAEVEYDKAKRTVNVKADTSGECKSINDILSIQAFTSEQAYDMAKTKYDNLLSTDGMPHYNHKGKYYMFLTGASSTVDVYYNGMLEIN